MSAPTPEPPRCRTCARTEGKVLPHHEQLLFVCRRCADRTPVRCGVCDASLATVAKIGELFSATCEECRDRIVMDDSGRETERHAMGARPAVEASVSAKEEEEDRSEASAATGPPADYLRLTRMGASEASYRSAGSNEHVVLAVDARKPDPRPRSSHRRTLLILGADIVVLTGSAALQLPALSMFLVACFTVVVTGALLFGSALASRSAAPKLLEPIPASRVRVDSDGIEAKPLDEDWSGRADADDVRTVYVTASKVPGFYRVRVELDAGQHRSLLDGFEKEAHAERAVAEIERVLRRRGESG